MTELSGTTLKGYELVERIGAGGFGAVYRARQTTIDREVAVKIILPGLANQPDFIRRFETEARLIARMEHPNIVPLHDFWRDTDGAYLVMRYLKGGSLRDALSKEGAYDLAATSHLLDQIGAALDFAHRGNIVHRDIKPENILLDEDGNAYLADFGIAKDLINTENSQTSATNIVGSLDYISPEQARSEPLTPRTDIYSLGVMIYEMITGEHPFKAYSSVERLYKHLNDPLPEITNLTDDTRDTVNAIIQRATAKNPAQRYPDVLALAIAFREASGRDDSSSHLSIVEQLTWREQEVLQLITEGHSNKEIADKLFVTLATVRWHLRQVYKKLGVRSRVQAIVRARELDLLVSGEADLQPAKFLSTMIAPPEPENPYKGLRAFEAADSRDFFGREALTEKLIQRLSEKERLKRFLTVIGPSGSGKSSLVKAGLIPALWKGGLPGSERWFVAEMTPGTRPIDQLEVALVRVAAHHTDKLREQLTRDENGLLRAADIILPQDSTELVLILDQFEEVFTLVEDERVRVQFLNLLYATVTDPRSRVRVIITLRADFYDRPLQYPEFGELVRTRMETVMPLSADSLERAIAQPAERVGAVFEPGLVSSIVADVNYQPGALPLLQYALTELFERRQGHTLTHLAYQEIGGAVGALAKQADQIYNELAPEAQELTRQMFLRLVTIGDGTDDARRRIRRSDLLSLATDADAMDELIDTFAAYRLLALDNDAGTRSPTVEVAHEAILREWRRLSTWIDESREDIRMRQQLDQTAEEWQEKSREVSYLASGQRLEQFAGWAADKRQALTALERAYIEASLAERRQQADEETQRQQRETRLEQRSRTFLRGLVVVLLLATLGAFGLTAVVANQSSIAQNEARLALIARQQAEDQTRIATARELVGYATGSLSSDAELSTLLAIQAVKTTYDADHSVLLEANTVLHQAVQTLHTSVKLVSATFPSEWTLNFSFNAEGTQIMYPVQVGSDSGELGVTGVADVRTGQLLYTVPGDALTPYSLDNRITTFGGTPDAPTFVRWDLTSRDSAQQVISVPIQYPAFANWGDIGANLHLGLTIEENGSLHIWDVATGQEIVTPSIQKIPSGYGEPIFSPDVRLMGNRNPDGTLSILDTSTWEEIGHLSPAGTGVGSFTFSPDSQSVITGNLNKTVTVWDATTGAERYTIVSDIVPKYTALSRDGSRLALGSFSGQISIWNTETQQPLLTLAASPMSGMAISSDGAHLATLHATGSVQIWDLIPGRELLTMNNDPVPDQGPVGLTYSPDGKRLVHASVSESPIVWDAETGAKLFTLAGHSARVIATAWSSDGKLIATGGEDTNIILWDAATGKQVGKLAGHSDNIYGLAFSPDGKLLASSSYDQTVRIWDLASNKQLLSLDQPAQSKGVAWSPDGKRIVAGTDVADDQNGHFRVWDATTGTLQLDLTAVGSRTGMVTFSPDGTRILGGMQEANVAVVWDATSGEKLLELSGDVSNVPGVAYSPDGQQIATASLDGTARLWDAATGKELLTLYTGGSGRVSFSPDGTRLATANFDGTLRIYILPIDDLIALAQSRLRRTWTPAECRRYLHTETCPA